MQLANKKGTRRFALGAALAALLPGIGLATAQAQESVVLKMHSQYVESRPEVEYLKEFSKLVSEKTDGRLEIKLFHAGSLGLKDADLLRILQAGAVDMAMLYGGYFKRDAPSLAAVYVQGAIKDAETHLEVLPTLRKIYKEAYAEWDIKTVGGIVSPIFDVGVHCNEPVNTLEELKGKKLRVWNSHLVDTFQRLDVAAQVIPQNDMYLALQTGVVDCAYYLSTVAPTVSLQEVTDYEAYLHPWAAVPVTFGMSPKAWQKLTPEMQDAVVEAGNEVWQQSKADAVDPEREDKARREREELGVTMLEPFPEEDVNAFMEAANKAWREMAEEAGPKGLEYYNRMQEALKKARSE